MENFIPLSEHLGENPSRIPDPIAYQPLME
jgi:hypothetical protein